MNRIVRLREEADRDLAEAASWYERQREGLGHEFLDEALSTFQLVAEQPLTYPVVHRATRRALMTREHAPTRRAPRQDVCYCALPSSALSHGFSIGTLVDAKSATLRVTTVMPCTRAVAAM
ncbi:MAG: hypothetical protein RBS02_14610 [Steroidobacteraceae bacterium]|jgi:plasmid stabilization system protein ParE|nr:hypothetical protein [Steroidobacteraceae bacterium]